MGVTRKILRCGISRKRLIVEPNGRKFGTRGPSVYMCGTFHNRLLEFGLGSFDALCKISYFIIFKSLVLPQFSSNFIQTLYHNHGAIQAITFLAICQKLKNIAFWNFLNTWPFSPTIFIGAHPNMRKLVTIINLNACYNAAMSSWHLIPKIIYSISKTFSKHSSVLGLPDVLMLGKKLSAYTSFFYYNFICTQKGCQLPTMVFVYHYYICKGLQFKQSVKAPRASS